MDKPNVIEKFNTAIFVEEFCQVITPIVGRVETIYEIGSLDGDDARRMRPYFPDAEVFVFEALKENYERYLKDDETLITFNVAISDTDGEATFYEKETNGIHSIHDRGGVGKSYTVATRRLDSIIEEYNLPQPEVMKIDVEGASIEVLRGMGKYLDGVRAIHLETEDYPYFQGEVLHDEVCKYLEEKGFILVQINKNKVDDNGHQYDTIWVK